MAAKLEDSGFWLPTHFPADQGKREALEKTEFEPGLCFPVEFPYEVDSPVKSMLSSNETDCSDDDDFLAGLTSLIAQRLSVPCFASENLEKQRVSAGSPQSTLSGIGSVSGNGSPTGNSQVSSPPATPFGVSNDTWELIYAAAGQVARLKMSGEAAKYSSQQQQSRGLLGPPGSNPNTVFYSNQSLTRNLPQPNQFHQFAKQEQAVKQQCHSVWAAPPPHQHHQRHVQIQNRVPNIGNENRRCGRPLDLSHSAWPPLQRQHQNQPPRADFLGGSASKRACAGTGVFLPRGHINPPDYRKKGGCSPVLVPAKVVQALNLNFNSGHTHPRGGAVAPDHEALMARRNALLREQVRSIVRAPEGHLSHEAVRLPQEWTY